ncbi:unnamed protein product [Miscanthus lutarioriparius]|uniref:Peptidase C1A papain C-terminal domain-containing protein n=1 Tax=Miscanthus lutarioriparius TaxID=422564 RepID=A0A811PQ58_9POAL|nr:unnamed protein product [Miscanthus lutarioriparius]
MEKLRRFQTFKETALRVASRAGVAGGRAPVSQDDDAGGVAQPQPQPHCSSVREKARRRLALPVAWDWREKTCGDQPCLGPVKDQGNCGSCWAFAATGAMEAHHAIIGARNKEKPIQLSQQELIDCDPGSDKCPVVVSIAVGDNNTEFRYYEGGVYGKDKKCGLWNDHELLLVGYDSNTYILKNSYGDDWGVEALINPEPYIYVKKSLCLLAART